MKCGRFPLAGILILVGILFLLSRILPISVNVWRLMWPLLFIWWGLRLLLAENKRPLPAPTPSQPQTGEVQYLSVPIKQVEEAHIRVKHDGGKLEIHSETAPDELLSGTFGRQG